MCVQNKIYIIIFYHKRLYFNLNKLFSVINHFIFCRLLPVAAVKRLTKFIGGLECMDGFVGRQKMK